MGLTNRRVAARKVLDGAKKHASKDVLVVSKSKDGEFYLASSMSSSCTQHIDEQIALMQEGLKLLRRVRQEQARVERRG